MRPLLAALLLCAGCAATPLDYATSRANAGVALAKQAETVRDQRCTDAYKRATAADVPRLDLYCIPLKQQLAKYEAAHAALAAAIVAVHLGMSSSCDEYEMLVARTANLDWAAQDLAAAIAWPVR